MNRRSLLQLSRQNVATLVKKQMCKSTARVLTRSLSTQQRMLFQNGTGGVLSNAKNGIPSCNKLFTRFYSERSTTSTHGIEVPQEIIDLPINTYHNEADKFLDTIFEQLEILSEDYPELIPEVELNHGVMTLNLAKLGPYVINKQPPNKQIWFASPISGPNRFDFYHNEWISLRDSTKLIDLINNEVKMAMPGHDIIIRKE